MEQEPVTEKRRVVFYKASMFCPSNPTATDTGSVCLYGYTIMPSGEILHFQQHIQQITISHYFFVDYESVVVRKPDIRGWFMGQGWDISEAPTAEKEAPASSVKPLKPGFTRVWYKVANVCPRGTSVDVAEIWQCIVEHLIENGYPRTGATINPFALPTSNTQKGIPAIEPLLRVNRAFRLPGVYDVPAATASEAWIDVARFVALYSEPIQDDVIPIPYAHIYKKGVDISTTMLSTAVGSSSSMATQNAAANRARRLNRFGLRLGFDGSDNDLVEIPEETCGVHLVEIIGFLKSGGGKPRMPAVLLVETDDKMWPSDSGVDVLTALCGDIITPNEMLRHWTVCAVRPHMCTDLDEMYETLSAAISVASITSATMSCMIHGLFFGSQAVKIADAFVTRALIRAKRTVLPWPRSAATERVKAEVDGDSDPMAKKNIDKAFKGGSTSDAKTGLFCADREHSIVHVDCQSYYPTIVWERKICPTKPLSYFTLPPRGINLAEEVHHMTDSVASRLNEAPLSTEYGALIMMRLKPTTRPAVKNALKTVLNSTYGTFAQKNMRYYCKPISIAVAAYGRAYIDYFRSELEAGLCDRGNSDGGLLLSITDSFVYHCRLTTPAKVEKVIAAAKKKYGIGRIRFGAPEFYSAIWIKNNSFRFWMPIEKTEVTVSTVRGLEPRQSATSEERKRVVLELMTACLLRCSGGSGNSNGLSEDDGVVYTPRLDAALDAVLELASRDRAEGYSILRTYRELMISVVKRTGAPLPKWDEVIRIVTKRPDNQGSVYNDMASYMGENCWWEPGALGASLYEF